MIAEEQSSLVCGEACHVKNGLFEFDDIPNGLCTCGHNQSDHLDCIINPILI